MSPGSARSMPATRRMSTSPSPCKRQSSRSAISFSFKIAPILNLNAQILNFLRGRDADAIEKRRQPLQIQTGGDGGDPRRPLGARQVDERPQPGEARIRLER